MYVIFTDTDTDVTPEIAKEYGYNLISMPYTIDDKDIYPYIDYDVFDWKKYYADLRGGVMPKTSGISPEAYKSYFEPFFKEGKDILYVHFSSAMSGTFNAMKIAEEELKELYPERKLYTVDTKGITILSHIIALEVGDLYKQGKSVEEILDWAKEEVDHFAIYFFAEDLKFFAKSGRVKGFKAFMGNLLGIRPIINVNKEGIMDSVDTAKGKNGTLNKILGYVDSLQDHIEDHRVIIGHSDAEEEAKLLADKLQEKYNGKLNISFMVVNPTIGSHCGPGGVGVTFHAKAREL